MGGCTVEIDLNLAQRYARGSGVGHERSDRVSDSGRRRIASRERSAIRADSKGDRDGTAALPREQLVVHGHADEVRTMAVKFDFCRECRQTVEA